jgi:hypothetical protein
MDWLIGFLSQYEWIKTTVIVIGSLRLVLKPVFSVLRTYVDLTASVKDNEWLKRLEEHKITKAIIYALDWLASVKLTK